MPIAPPGKTQFNVYLPVELVTAAKHAAVDLHESMSTFVEVAVRARLEAITAEADSEEESR